MHITLLTLDAIIWFSKAVNLPSHVLSHIVNQSSDRLKKCYILKNVYLPLLISASPLFLLLDWSIIP